MPPSLGLGLAVKSGSPLNATVKDKLYNSSDLEQQRGWKEKPILRHLQRHG